MLKCLNDCKIDESESTLVCDVDADKTCRDLDWGELRKLTVLNAEDCEADIIEAFKDDVRW